ncbi:BadF/BadG/BcrA/BcrD ATPase family protein [Glycomyces mayteni]|uniref:BadF/BadG/BcrA/BcrD ATPase family protein n=1 Tax=Glycomyces mayteni TaxID=543887 RepID=A0ABW2D0A4_9ACTN
MSTLVLGLDVGGTSSRAVTTTLDGAVVGRGAAGGGNPLAVPPDLAAAEVARALAAALAGTDPRRIAAAVLGLAGVSGFDRPETSAAFQRVWDAAGLQCPVAAVGDAQVAFASGTDAPLGTVLIAGTGAAAARIDADRITRVGDGLGWLLGDKGSGFWIGRRAAADTAASLQSGRPPTLLTHLVMQAVLDGGLGETETAATHSVPTYPAVAADATDTAAADSTSTDPAGAAGGHTGELDGGPDVTATAATDSISTDPASAAGTPGGGADRRWSEGTAGAAEVRAAGTRPGGLTADARRDSRAASDAFVIAVHQRPPRSLDRLAPLVTEAALAGDEHAAAILDEAAAHLAAAVASVRDAGEATPIVLSGSVLRGSAPVRDGVRARLAAAWPGAPVTEAGPAELGAAKLAVLSLQRPSVAPFSTRPFS